MQAEAVGTADEVVRERWIHLAVAWLYDHRGEFEDPWTVIEAIWEALRRLFFPIIGQVLQR